MSRILIIEDEKPLREEIVDTLTFEGFDVIHAENGRIGVTLAKEQHPDLIVCDITMPELDGYGVLEALRQHPTTTLIPFIFLTARADKSFMRHGMELGADDYVTKPFTRGEILSAIRARLARSTSIAAAHGQKLEEIKTKLTTLVAHELRTPLSSITLIRDIIGRQLDNLSPEETRQLVDTMDSGVDRLAHLVEQMVYLTYLETGSLSRNAIRESNVEASVSQILSGAIHVGRRFAFSHRDGVIALDDTADGASIVGHPPALRHAVAELVANALNFSGASCDVSVTCQQSNDGVSITIRDHGIGMSLQEQQQLFGKFSQANRANREQQGAGLGLYVARGIIEAHGGSIRVKSEAGRGTEVTLELPISRSERA